MPRHSRSKVALIGDVQRCIEVLLDRVFCEFKVAVIEPSIPRIRTGTTRKKPVSRLGGGRISGILVEQLDQYTIRI